MIHPDSFAAFRQREGKRSGVSRVVRRAHDQRMGSLASLRSDAFKMKCPACTADLPEGSVFCTTCGHRMVLNAPGPTVPGAPPAAAPGAATAAAVGDPGRASTGYAALGAVVDGKYTIERVLGEGGMGVVYLAREVHTGMEVVLKAVRGEIAHRADMRERTLAEGRALARIDHPNVVQLKAVVVEEGRMWLVMQFIEGENLEDVIQRHVQQRQPMPLAEALGVFRQILSGVAAAHNEGVIHRDLKPANILIRRKDHCVKVTDFGIAKGEDDAQQGRGQTQGIIGSLFYMSSEQVRGQRDLDRRVDIYALGIVLYEMLTGQVPFNSDNTFELLRMHVEGVMPSVLGIRPDVPPQIDHIIQTACSKDRDHRYPSCEEFLRALDTLGAAGNAATVMAPPTAAFPARPAAGLAPPGHTQIPSQPPPGMMQPGMAPPGMGPSGMYPHAPGTITGQPAVFNAPGGRPRKSNAGLFIAIGALAAGGATVGVLFGTGVIGGGGETSHAGNSTESTSTGHTGGTAKPPESQKPAPSSSTPLEPSAAPKKSPLAELAGRWRSEAGNDYEAVPVGKGDNMVVEFRIVDPAQFGDRGYNQDEPRFVLSPSGDGDKVFDVDDRIRPRLPIGTSLDSAARGSCLIVVKDVRGDPLHANLRGGQLQVEFTKLEPTAANFTVAGTTVVGCKGLEKLDTAKGPQTYTRQ